MAEETTMKREILFMVVAAVIITSCTSKSGGLSQGAPTSASSLQATAATSWTFNLISPNTAKAESGPFTGDTIRVTGSGAFGTGSIVGDGSFTHIKADGTVFARGVWQATGFGSFTPFGGPSPGAQGGQLRLTVTLLPDGGSPVAGVPMSLTCLVNAPAGFTEEEGTTVGAFTEKTGGKTLFHQGS